MKIKYKKAVIKMSVKDMEILRTLFYIMPRVNLSQNQTDLIDRLINTIEES